MTTLSRPTLVRTLPMRVAPAARRTPDAEAPVVEAVQPLPGKAAEAELLLVRAGAAALPRLGAEREAVPEKGALLLPVKAAAKAARAARAAKVVLLPLVEAAEVPAKVAVARETQAHPLQVRAVQGQLLQVHLPVARVVRVPAARAVRVPGPRLARAQVPVAREARPA